VIRERSLFMGRGDWYVGKIRIENFFDPSPSRPSNFLCLPSHKSRNFAYLKLDIRTICLIYLMMFYPGEYDSTIYD
jgi:hypothetical protein